jgi:hypothetical protein
MIDGEYEQATRSRNKCETRRYIVGGCMACSQCKRSKYTTCPYSAEWQERVMQHCICLPQFRRTFPTGRIASATRIVVCSRRRNTNECRLRYARWRREAGEVLLHLLCVEGVRCNTQESCDVWFCTVYRYRTHFARVYDDHDDVGDAFAVSASSSSSSAFALSAIASLSLFADAFNCLTGTLVCFCCGRFQISFQPSG